MLEQELIDLEEEKTKAVLAQDFTTADHLRIQGERLNKQVLDLKRAKDSEHTEKKEILANDIINTVVAITKIPLAKMVKEEAIKLTNLEEHLPPRRCWPGRSVKSGFPINPTLSCRSNFPKTTAGFIRIFRANWSGQNRNS